MKSKVTKEKIYIIKRDHQQHHHLSQEMMIYLLLGPLKNITVGDLAKLKNLMLDVILLLKVCFISLYYLNFIYS